MYSNPSDHPIYFSFPPPLTIYSYPFPPTMYSPLLFPSPSPFTLYHIHLTTLPTYIPSFPLLILPYTYTYTSLSFPYMSDHPTQTSPSSSPHVSSPCSSPSYSYATLPAPLTCQTIPLKPLPYPTHESPPSPSTPHPICYSLLSSFSFSSSSPILILLSTTLLTTQVIDIAYMVN